MSKKQLKILRSQRRYDKWESEKQNVYTEEVNKVIL